MSGLDEARAELERNPPPPLNIADHPQSLKGLGELLDEREQGERAEPAA